MKLYPISWFKAFHAVFLNNVVNVLSNNTIFKHENDNVHGINTLTLSKKSNVFLFTIEITSVMFLSVTEMKELINKIFLDSKKVMSDLLTKANSSRRNTRANYLIIIENLLNVKITMILAKTLSLLLLNAILLHLNDFTVWMWR